MDAVGAFLNSDCKEELYLELPDGYKGEGDMVAKLDKTLYGLKQSAHEWNEDVRNFLTSQGFIVSPADQCIYTRSSSDGKRFSAIYVHVDDMAITGNEIDSIKDCISSHWEMEDLGIASCVVGIQIRRPSKYEYSLGQPAMIESLLARFGMISCKPASTPFPPDLKLVQGEDQAVSSFSKQNLPYRSGVCSLIYLAQCTRPDIAYAVSVLAQHFERPTQDHWDAFIHVLQYLKSTKDLFIHYNTPDNRTVEGNQSWSCPHGHSDADWAGDKSTRRSTTGYVFKLFGGAISWKSKLQATVALSSTEAEYRSTTEAGQEAVWLRLLLKSFNDDSPEPTTLHCDNLGAIQLTSKSTFHARTKHIEIHYHFIRELVSMKTVCLKHCPTERMIADILTKPLGKGPFQFLRHLCGMSPLSAYLKSV